MTLYERFEQLVAIALSLIIAILILIALLAMSRKFVILDSSAMSAATIAALAAVTLVLGAVYWFLKDQDVSR